MVSKNTENRGDFTYFFADFDVFLVVYSGLDLDKSELFRNVRKTCR